MAAGVFERTDIADGTLGFTYTDIDGDSIEVYRYSPLSGLRIKQSNREGVLVEAGDLDEFESELKRLRKFPCPNCKGQGVVEA